MSLQSPVSDIHICGCCRSEFHDIYQFIDHKKQCSSKSNKHQSQVHSNTKQATFVDHNVTSNHGHAVEHSNQSNFQYHDQPAKMLPHTKTPVQTIYHEDRNIFNSYPSDQQSSVALNLSYEGVPHEMNSIAQYQTVVDSTDVTKQEQSRLNYTFEVSGIAQQSSSSFSSSNIDSNTNKTSTATSQELLNSTGNTCISAVSDNTVDSTALCLEDLEVGQISEAMMGQLDQKFHPKETGLLNRKLNGGSSKRVGRLDPISTFTLRRKSNKKSVNASKDIARSLPFTGNRMNSSSVPLEVDDKFDSPDNHLNLKGLTLEKRERLQGVSDDLLNQSLTPFKDSVETGNERTQIHFQNAVGIVSDEHKMYSTQDPSKSHSVYKAVFTSPSSGGHRLSVKLPDEENGPLSVKQSQLLIRGHNNYERENMNTIILDEKNRSTDYKNISKLTDTSKIEKDSIVPNVLEFESNESVVSNSNFLIETDANNVGSVKLVHNKEAGKEYSMPRQQVNAPAVELSQQTYSSSSKNIQSYNETVISLPNTHNANNNSCVVIDTNTSNERAPVAQIATNYNSWEPEEIQVIASADRTNYVHLSTAGNEGNEIEVSVNNDIYPVDGNDTMVCFVYKRDDGDLIMMCKPNESTDDGGDKKIENAALQAVIQSVVNDNGITVAHDQQPLHFVAQQHQGEQHIQHDSNTQIADHDKGHKKIKGTSPRMKEKSMRKIKVKPTEATLNSGTKCDLTAVKKSVKGTGSNKVFTCHFGSCSYSTKLDKDFQRHYRIHTGEKPYKCDRCDKSFSRTDKLKNHLRSHEGQKPFKCKICDYATKDNSSLKKHMRIHNDERPFQCQICPYASRNSSQLIVHLRTHTGDAPFHCSHCSAQFKINSDLKRHVRIHTGEKPYACDKCDYRSSNMGNLKIHHKINHSLENQKSCSQCSFASSSLKRLREHVKIHDEARIIKCSMCQYTCNSSTALRSHMMVHNTLRPYRCPYCPYSSKQSGNLKKHVQNVHHQDKNRLGGSTSGKLSVKHSSSSSSSMSSSLNKSHRISNSTSRKRKRAKQDTAGSNPKSDGYHQRPARRPSSSRKNHSCPECGCSFVRHDSLRCHLKQHWEKEKPSKTTDSETNVTAGSIISNIKNEQTVPVFNTTSILSLPQPLPASLPQLQQQHPAPPQLHLESLRVQKPQQPQTQPQILARPPPPPLTPYRSKGLDSIVAAASQVYQEEYGKQDDDEDVVNGKVISKISTPSSIQFVSVSNTANTTSFHNNHPSSCVMKSATQNITYDIAVQGSNSNNTFSHSSPYTTASIESDHQSRSTIFKRPGGGVLYSAEEIQEAQPSANKKQKTNDKRNANSGKNIYRAGLPKLVSNTDEDKNGQVPWEHSSYTASRPPSNISTDLQQRTQKSSPSPSRTRRLQSVSQSTSSLTSSSSSSSSHCVTVNPGNQPIVNSDKDNTGTSQMQIEMHHVNPHNQSGNTSSSSSSPYYQYRDNLSFESVDTPGQPSQPISIQLVQQPAAVYQSQPVSQSQNIVSSMSFPQQKQQSSDGIPQAPTALQILLPAGTQIIQQPAAAPPLPRLQPSPALATPRGEGNVQPSQQHHQQQQIVGQPQIVFQVQEAPSMTGHRADIVTIPASMATQHLVLGQCPPYGLSQNRVITSPADSTTMGGAVYNVSDGNELQILESNPVTEYKPASTLSTTQGEPPVA